MASGVLANNNVGGTPALHIVDSWASELLLAGCYYTGHVYRDTALTRLAGSHISRVMRNTLPLHEDIFVIREPGHPTRSMESRTTVLSSPSEYAGCRCLMDIVPQFSGIIAWVDYGQWLAYQTHNACLDSDGGFNQCDIDTVRELCRAKSRCMQLPVGDQAIMPFCQSCLDAGRDIVRSRTCYMETRALWY